MKRLIWAVAAIAVGVVLLALGLIAMNMGLEISLS